MDIFDEELLSFWRHLNNASVKFIMVGGVATNLHGYNRSTDDIDVWIDDTIEKRKNFRKGFLSSVADIVTRGSSSLSQTPTETENLEVSMRKV